MSHCNRRCRYSRMARCDAAGLRTCRRSARRVRHVVDRVCSLTPQCGTTAVPPTRCFAVTLDSMTPTRHAIYGNDVWPSLYATSLVRNRYGTIYIGMRSAVSRLTPSTNGYIEDWLVPTSCVRRVPRRDGFLC